jgi:serine/threonine protein phosphatase PrpC
MKVYLFTDKGKTRSINEDSILVISAEESVIINQSVSFFSERDIHVDCMCLVSDGMGGHESGEIASNIVCIEFKRWFKQLTKHKFNSDKEVVSSISSNFLKIDNILNQEAKSELHSPGATIAGILFLQKHGIFIFHAGDSRVYKSKGNILQQYTLDHNDYQMRIQNGLEGDELLHVGLTNCVGGGGEDNFLEVKKYDPKSKDSNSWIICSDGIHGFLNQDELEELTSEKEAELGFIQMKKILDEKYGSPDNLSIIALYKD